MELVLKFSPLKNQHNSSGKIPNTKKISHHNLKCKVIYSASMLLLLLSQDKEKFHCQVLSVVYALIVFVAVLLKESR